MARVLITGGAGFIGQGGAEADRTAGRDVLKRIPDITKARTLLGYDPSVSLPEGVARIIASGEILSARSGNRAWASPTEV